MRHTVKVRSAGMFCVSFGVLATALLFLFFAAVNTGSIHLGIAQLWNGLFVEYDPDVAAVYDLRFPRILISLMAGATLAAAGTLFQAVLRNPLADPGILGVASGAEFAAVLATALVPQLYSFVPAFSFLGGILAFVVVYRLAWTGRLSPLRIILLGVAVQSLFEGLSAAFGATSSGTTSTVASIVNGNITMKTWQDVRILAFFSLLGLILAIVCSRWCNLLALEDKTVRGLGIQVDKVRMLVSLIAVFLVSGCTAIVGTVSFLGLIAPHIGRIIVGSDHRKLIPFTMLLGAFCFLLADTLGRSIAYPYEISASIIMSVAGGIAFVILLQRSGMIHGK